MSGNLVKRGDDLPALIADGERALELLATPDEAELALRKAKAVEHAARLAQVQQETQLAAGKLKLRTWRRWGELLGPAEPQAGPGRGHKTVTGSNGFDRVAVHRARQLADVTSTVFERWIKQVTDPEVLRFARVLRLSREDEPEDDVPPTASDGTVEIRLGDLREVLDDLAGTVDAVITDPPYGGQFIDEFAALGEVCARLLKPTGLLAAMVGQAHLPHYLALLGEHLPYRWTAAYLTDGPATRIHGRKVGTKWKPVLIFGGERFLTQDVFHSERREQPRDRADTHPWGQSESGMADIVDRLTQPGELVVDPFLGAGTTAVVCRDLGRDFVGCDVDEAAYRRAHRRLF